MFEQINFVAGTRGAVLEDDFITISKDTMYKQETRTSWWRMCNAFVKRMTQKSDPTISKYMGRLGPQRRDNVDGEPCRTSLCVNNSQSFCHQLLKKGEDRAKLE